MFRSISAENRNVMVIRITILFWWIGWYIKTIFLAPYFFDFCFEVPVYHKLFPVFFTDPRVSAFFYLLPTLIVIALVFPRRRNLLLAGMIMSISSMVMMLHINSYNDATFVTSFWVGLWVLWLSLQSKPVDAVLPEQACFLARLVLGLIFFAGFIGKLTPQFMSGEVFHNIFWVDNTIWPHKRLIENYSQLQLMSWSRYAAGMIVVTEGILALAPLIRSRWFYIISPMVMLGFTITNTWAILSVLSCLIGMMWSCLLFIESPEREA